MPLSIPVRALSVFLATLPLRLPRGKRRATLAPLTWAGLHGGISVALALALALALAHVAQRPSLLAVRHGVMVFTIIVQG